MPYDIEKLIDILVTLAKNNQELTKLRINKLLYFIDKYHLQKYGRLVLNDRYYRLEFGPIPSISYNLINEFFQPDIRIFGRKLKRDHLKEYFIPGKDDKGHDLLNLKKEVNFHSLSQSEIEVTSEVIRKFGRKSTGTLVNISHRDRSWTETDEPDEIDYELLLDKMTDDKKEVILQLMEIDKESDCLNSAINK